MRRFLETGVILLQLIILLAVALFWWSRVNEDMNGGPVNWVTDQYHSFRSWLDRFLAGPRAQQFRTWADRYWGEQIDLDGE